MGSGQSQKQIEKNVQKQIQELNQYIELGDDAKACDVYDKLPGRCYDFYIDLFKRAHERKMPLLIHELSSSSRRLSFLIGQCTTEEMLRPFIRWCSVIYPTQFANTDMFTVYLKTIDNYYRFKEIFRDANNDTIDKYAPCMAAVSIKLLKESISGYYAIDNQYLKKKVEELIQMLMDKNTLAMIAMIEKKDHHGASDLVEEGYINFNMIYNGESLLMLALKHDEHYLAYQLVKKVPIYHTYNGRNAMHYAVQYDSTLITNILDVCTPVWDMKFVTPNLAAMQRYVAVYHFKRAVCLEIFEMLTQMNISDEDLRSFYDTIQKSVAYIDIPNLLKLLDKFPLTHDRLADIIKPSKLEAENMALRASAAVPPPAYAV